ncbi:MAG: SCO family protein [Methyloligellaceae bacterium]
MLQPASVNRSGAKMFLAAVILAGLLIPFGTGVAAQTTVVLDEKSALRISQAAIGRQLSDHRFNGISQNRVQLAQYRGKPLVLNLVYTSCYHTCPLAVQTLARAVEMARDAFGEDSFNVVTIGFDARHDTPARMRSYARSQGIDYPNWQFLSATPETIDALVEEVGFVFYPSPRGFDHIAQTTVVDESAVVYRQLYGANFEPPALVEPLKDLVFGRKSDFTSLSGVINRVRLFCTIYDPSSDRYRFDYGVIVGTVIAIASLTGIAIVLIRSWRRTASHQRKA